MKYIILLILLTGCNLEGHDEIGVGTYCSKEKGCYAKEFDKGDWRERAQSVPEPLTLFTVGVGLIYLSRRKR